jgi:hypothetical protein
LVFLTRTQHGRGAQAAVTIRDGVVQWSSEPARFLFSRFFLRARHLIFPSGFAPLAVDSGISLCVKGCRGSCSVSTSHVMGHILFGDGTYIRGTDSTEEPSLSFPLLKRGTLLPLFRHNFFGCPHIMRAPEAAQLNGFPMKGERESPFHFDVNHCLA